MILIPWKDQYSVQVKEIDEQHKKLLIIINQLYEAIKSQSSHKNLVTLVKELIDFSEYHFTTEEKYFDLCNYEDKEPHKKEHQKFKEKILTTYNTCRSSECQGQELEIAFELIDFMEDWFVEHFISMDQKYIPCFKKYGLK